MTTLESEDSELRDLEREEFLRREAAIIQIQTERQSVEKIVGKLPIFDSIEKEEVTNIDSGILSSEQISLEALRQTLEARRVEITQLSERVSAPFPIPSELDTASEWERFKPSDAELVVIDKYPDAIFKSDPVELKKRLVERLPRGFYETEASVLFSLSLLMEPGRSFTYAELGDLIYGHRDDVTNRAQRAAALLNNYVNENSPNQIIGKYLETEGFVLQKGLRRTKYVNSGKQIGKSTVVVRAISVYDLDRTDEVVYVTPKETTFVEVDNRWVNFEYIPEDISEETDDILESSELNFEAEPIVTVINEDQDVELELPDVTVSENSTGEELVDFDKNSWEEDFVNHIQEAIKKLVDLGIMINLEPISVKVASAKSKSKTSFTETAFERAYKRKIIRNNKPDTISAAEAVLLTIQNSFRDIFASSVDRRLAIELVEDTVENYFLNQRH